MDKSIFVAFIENEIHMRLDGHDQRKRFWRMLRDSLGTFHGRYGLTVASTERGTDRKIVVSKKNVTLTIKQEETGWSVMEGGLGITTMKLNVETEETLLSMVRQSIVNLATGD